jgi:hypothetical protein
MFFSVPFRCRPTSFPSSLRAIPHPSHVAILHRQRAFRVASRLPPARSMRACHPPKSALFRPLRPLHLCSRLPKHDIDFHDVIKCNHLYRQLPPTSLVQPAKNTLNVAHYNAPRPLPFFIPHPSHRALWVSLILSNVGFLVSPVTSTSEQNLLFDSHPLRSYNTRSQRGHCAALPCPQPGRKFAFARGTPLEHLSPKREPETTLSEP